MRIARMNPSRVIWLLAPVGFALLTGCSAPEERTVREVERLQKDGFARKAMVESEKALESDPTLTPEQRERLAKVRDESRARLVRFAISTINRDLMAENFQDALATYEEALTTYPEIVENTSLGRRIMRAYVRNGQVDRARQTASLALQAASSESARADLEKFLARLDELETAAARREELRQQVELIGSSIGVDFSSIEGAPTCIVMNETRKLTPESSRVVDEYFVAVMQQTGIINELGTIPSAVY